MAMQSRPPVITIMGHVDHGKTSLLDYIRKTKVAAREAGGITQHIGAYTAFHNGKQLTFIDTPGHAAFSKMRERGAKVTDIIVLVVAANDGVKPQTIESIRHIKNSQATLVVAINKMDMEGAYPEMVKAQLAEHDIKVQGYGGSTDAIEISAKTGKGIDTLLETIAVTAELEGLTADPEAPLKAVVIESTKDPRRGAVASVIVQQGTLRVRQELVVEGIVGRVRLLTGGTGENLNTVTPGLPAEIIGLPEVPPVGAVIHDTSAVYEEISDEAAEVGTETVDDSDKFSDIGFLLENKPKLPLIIRADVEGTLEAIINTLDEESVNLLSFGVGPVIEQDIELAAASGATIISFHQKLNKQVRDSAKNRGVKIKTYDVIYELIEDLQRQMLRLLEPTIDEVVTGEAEVLQMFEIRGERIAGCRVKTGEIKKSDLLHLKRDGKIVANPVIKGLMHGKEEIQLVKAKNECGMTFKNKKLDFQVGDVIVAYHVED